MKRTLYLICGAPSGRKQNLIPIKVEGKERNNTFFFEIKTPSAISFTVIPFKTGNLKIELPFLLPMVRDLTGKHPQYFEAILQLRDITPEVLAFVEEDIQHYRIPVPKIIKLKTGYDFYLADSNYAKALGRKLQQQFNGKPLISQSVYGQKDGKQVFRVTILFRQASFQKGDIVSYKGEEHQVLLMDNEIVLQHQQTGKKLRVKYREINLIKKEQ